MLKVFNYSYYPQEFKGENQYKDLIESGAALQVDARYIKSFANLGNPFIEALPRFLSTNEVVSFYNRPIDTPNEDELKEMDIYDKLQAVEMLEDIRYPLNFHADVEREFHFALIKSYRKRRLMADPNVDIPYTINGSEKTAHTKMVADEISGSVTGFSLLGISGCGKSSCLNLLTDNYPQVITHHPDSNTTIQQIVYLKIVCSQGSNFSTLFNEVGHQIDIALGNVLPVYQAQIERKKTLGGKVAEVAKLIELFNIGIIIFDEIQQINIGTTRENSIETLLTLSNMTNVALAVAGTEESFIKLFHKRRLARRLGELIVANKYCDNRKTFDRIMRNLFTYSWTGVYSTPSPEMLDLMYEITDGIIDSMTKLYKYIQIDLVKEMDKGISAEDLPPIDCDFIKKVTARHTINVSKKVNKIHGASVKRTMIEMNSNGALMNTPAQEEKQSETEREMEEILDAKGFMDGELQKLRMIDRLSVVFKPSIIEKTFEKITEKLSGTLNDDEMETLIRQTIEKKDAESRKKAEGKKNYPGHEEMKSKIMESHNEVKDVLCPSGK